MAIFRGTNGNDTANAAIGFLSGGFQDGNDDLFEFFVDALGDYIAGFDGDDFIFAGPGDDLIEGGEGFDLLNGAEGNDTIYAFGELNPGGSLIGDEIMGNIGDDRLYGANGGDVIDGGSGSDTIEGNGGNDLLQGGINGDIDEIDVIFGGGGNDSIYAATQAVPDNTLTHATISGGTGSDTIIGADGSSNSDNLRGDAGNDMLEGGGGRDQIDGGDGNDVIRLFDGDLIDDVSGGLGSDTLDLSGVTNAGALIDLFEGSWSLNGLAFRTRIASMNIVIGTQVGDTMLGGDADETLNGGLGNDQLNGNEGDDRVTGGDGEDRLNGHLGSDGLYGDAGNDRLTGGAGNDVLTGGLGRDVMTGSTGSDRFDVNATVESGVVAATRDVIVDFNAGKSTTAIDRIDVSAIDSIAGGANNAFIFGGSFKAGHILAVQSGAHVILQFNTDGDAQAEMTMQLNNLSLGNLNSGDFVL